MGERMLEGVNLNRLRSDKALRQITPHPAAAKATQLRPRFHEAERIGLLQAIYSARTEGTMNICEI